MARNVMIMGASGRDFHNFNVFFRDNKDFRVVCFTSAAAAGTSPTAYPPALSGRLYPNGVPICQEDQLEPLIASERVTDVYFSYSDVSHESVMHKASTVQACGASFHLLGPTDTMLKSSRPVIAIVASRGGSGKSTICRKLVDILRRQGLKPVVVRHPMPRVDLAFPMQRFENPEDLDAQHVSMEERNEYMSHIERGVVVFAGVDYAAVMQAAEREGDVIIWDGGYNDFSFYRPDLDIAVVDAVRQGHESRYYPGETNVRMADVIVVNKVNIATQEDVEKAVQNCNKLNPRAKILRMRSESILDRPEWVRGRRVVVVEDGPSMVRGEFPQGAGTTAAKAVDATPVDPRAKAVGSIKNSFEKYPNIGNVLPAFGYGGAQLKELEETINSIDCDAVVFATPADLTKLVRVGKPVTRVRFEAFDMERPTLEDAVLPFLKPTRPEASA